MSNKLQEGLAGILSNCSSIQNEFEKTSKKLQIQLNKMHKLSEYIRLNYSSEKDRADEKDDTESVSDLNSEWSSIALSRSSSTVMISDGEITNGEYIEVGQEVEVPCNNSRQMQINGVDSGCLKKQAIGNDRTMETYNFLG